MKVLISGASGFIGSALRAHLTAAGHEVIPLVRSGAQSGIRWDPGKNFIEREQLEGCDAIINLAGRNIAKGRWSRSVKAAILQSRVSGTALIADTVRKLERPPRILLSASATGFYGDRGEELLTEASAPGDGFLSDVVQAWENSTACLNGSSTRVAFLRFGLVLDPRGGALRAMLLPFRLGLGGRLGSGVQYVSWISLRDLARAVELLLRAPEAQGPFNFVSPGAVTNTELTKTLAAVLNRPAVLPVPAPFLKLALGEMADELFLASARVVPERLTAAGFQFEHSALEPTLRSLLDRASGPSASRS